MGVGVGVVVWECVRAGVVVCVGEFIVGTGVSVVVVVASSGGSG